MADYLFCNENGFAVDLLSVPDETTIDLMIHPDLQPSYHLKGNAEVGWRWEDGAFAPPLPAPVVDRPVIESVSSAQAKTALSRMPGSAVGKSLFDDARVVASSSGVEVQIWFTDARVWEISSPNLIALTKGLGLSADAVAGLFQAASIIAA